MDSVELFRQVIERGFNQGDLSVADEVCAEDFAEHQYLLPTDLPGPEILKIEIQSARRSMRGLNLSIEDMVADGDKVWARMVARGTDPHSGQSVAIDVMDVCRFEDGRMVEHWGIPDRFALLHQPRGPATPSRLTLRGGRHQRLPARSARSQATSGGCMPCIPTGSVFGGPQRVEVEGLVAG